MLTLFEQLGEVSVTRRDGPVLEIDVELPLELPTLEHTLREAARGPRGVPPAVSGFGLDNLPYGVVGRPTASSATSDHVLDLERACPGSRRVFDRPDAEPVPGARPPGVGGRAREGHARCSRPARSSCGRSREPELPVAVGDYVDFYSSLEHATNLGRMFRPTTSRCRPPGARCRSATTGAPARSSSPARRSCARTGCGRAFGPTEAARLRARARLHHRPRQAPRRPDRQRPTCASTSSASCWSTTGARATCSAGSTARSGRSWASRSRRRSRRGSCRWPRSSRYRVPARAQDPEPRRLPAHRRRLGARHRARGRAQRRDRSAAATPAALYWTVPQQLAHATVNGAAVRPGDLFASGTISGSDARHAGLPARARARRSSPTATR